VKIYIYDILLVFSKISSTELSSFDRTLPETTPLDLTLIKGNVVATSNSLLFLANVLDAIQVQKPQKLKSITFPIEDKNLIKKLLKTRYSYIKAAGGLVRKNGDFLFIFRLKKWDLPKGKLEKGESIAACAVREVEEECSVSVKIGPKIGSTWHCYPTKSGWCVKKSTWYLMECTDDSKMQPQYQEDIEDIVWVAPKSVQKYLDSSYGTIHDVFHKAQKKGLI
jgi:8-oxo-dGTP pyrophosphatase MutT (NUDIX family)